MRVLPLIVALALSHHDGARTQAATAAVDQSEQENEARLLRRLPDSEAPELESGPGEEDEEVEFENGGRIRRHPLHRKRVEERMLKKNTRHHFRDITKKERGHHLDGMQAETTLRQADLAASEQEEQAELTAAAVVVAASTRQDEISSGVIARTVSPIYIPTRPPSGQWDAATSTELVFDDGAATTQLPLNDDELTFFLSCEFCPQGLTVDAGFVVPASVVDEITIAGLDAGATCKSMLGQANDLEESDAACPRLQLVQKFCCPLEPTPNANESSVDDEEGGFLIEDFLIEAAQTGTGPIATVQEQEDPNFCSCSPLTYDIRLSLTQLCDVDDLENNDGIGLTLCVFQTLDDDDDDEQSFNRLLLADAMEDVLDAKSMAVSTDSSTNGGQRKLTHKQKDLRNKKTNQQKAISNDQLRNLVTVVDIQFLEFGTQGDLTVINQDDRNSISLRDGDMVSFDSISKDLNSNMGLEEQLDYVPGGVQITLRGRLEVANDEDGNGTAEEVTVVNQRLTWSYTNGCGGVPVVEGDRIGWLTFESLEPASTDFCPVAPEPIITESPTKTPTAKPTSKTAAPTNQPTQAPTASDMPTISSEPSQVPSPTPSAVPTISLEPSQVPSTSAMPTISPMPTMSPTMMSLQLTGKSAKTSKSVKSSKSANAKAAKTKAHKDSDTKSSKLTKQHKQDKEQEEQDQQSMSLLFSGKSSKLQAKTKAHKVDDSKANKEHAVASDGHKVLTKQAKTLKTTGDAKGGGEHSMSIENSSSSKGDSKNQAKAKTTKETVTEDTKAGKESAEDHGSFSMNKLSKGSKKDEPTSTKSHKVPSSKSAKALHHEFQTVDAKAKKVTSKAVNSKVAKKMLSMNTEYSMSFVHHESKQSKEAASIVEHQPEEEEQGMRQRYLLWNR